MEVYLEIVIKHQAESLGAIDNILSPIGESAVGDAYLDALTSGPFHHPEFAFAGLAMYVLDEYYTIPAIAVIIGQMRITIRAKHKDVRANSAVIKALYNWLREVPRPAKKRRAIEDSGDEEDNSAGGKRYRVAARDDDDFTGPGLSPEDQRTIHTRYANGQLR